MTGRLGGRATASIIVTCITLTGSISIVDPGTADEGCSGMTIVAIQTGCKMRRIDLGILTFCCHTIVAGFATVNDAGMIKHRASKRTGVMTNTTILNGRNMRDWFAGGETRTMT